MFGVVIIRCQFPIAERKVRKTSLHSGTSSKSVVFAAMNQAGLDDHGGRTNMRIAYTCIYTTRRKGYFELTR